MAELSRNEPTSSNQRTAFRRADIRDVATAHFPSVRAVGFSGRSSSWLRRTSPGSSPIMRISAGRSWRHLSPDGHEGLSVTLGLTVVAMMLGTILGLFLAIARMSNDRLAARWRDCSSGSSAAHRCSCSLSSGTICPRCSRRSRSGSPSARPWQAGTRIHLITPMTAAIVGLALNEAAYMAEIIRGGLLSVDKARPKRRKPSA